MRMSDVEVVDWNKNAHFPELPEDAIARPHQLHAIEDALSTEVPVIFLEGEALDGATWTLAQFCAYKSAQTFSLFITPASKLTYSIDYLRLLLAEQFAMCLDTPLVATDSVPKSEYDSLRVKALRRFNNSRPAYFVLDGLHQIPDEDAGVITQIFSELLPFGFPQCRFVITGREQQLKRHLHKTIRSRYFGLYRFNLSETKQLLSDCISDDSDCNRVYSICRNGSPGLLAVVKRLLQNGTDLEDLLQHKTAKLLDFVRMEFEPLAAFPRSQQLLLAHLAFSKVQLSRADLAQMVQVSSGEVEEVIKRCSFLKSGEGKPVEYVSESHRSIAASMLMSYRNEAHEQQLKLLESRPNSDVALQFMPVYLETLNRREALFALLSRPDHYGALLAGTQSFSALRAQAELAAKAALENQLVNEVFRFSLQRSIFLSASVASGDSARVRALVALGKTDAALALANTERTKEDRLALLCTYARLYSERHGKPEPQLLEYLSKLIAEVDFSGMGDKAMDIAADVLIFDADSAIGIIESAVKGQAVGVRDVAFARLSLSASLGRPGVKVDDKVRAQISDESLQKIAHSFDVLAHQLDASSLKSLIAKMPPAHQIHFLRTIVSIRRKEPYILDLVDLGLDTIIQEPAYTPRARDLAELCSPLTFDIEDKKRLQTLIARFDSQVGLVARSAQSRDLTLLQMRLAAGLHQFDRAAARERIAGAYYASMGVKAPEVRLECLAVMLSELTRLDVDGYLEEQDGLREVIRSDLNEVVNVILEGTGDHLAAVLPVVKVLANDDSAAALLLAKRLNVQHRRDAAYENVARVLAAQAYTIGRAEALREALNSISTEDRRANATVALLGALNTNPDKRSWVGTLDDLRSHCMRGYQLSEWDCWMFSESAVCGVEYESTLFEARVAEALARCASPIEEARLHFNSAEAISCRDPDRAQQFYTEGLRISQSHALATQARSRLFELCLSLVSRSLVAVAKQPAFDEGALSRLLQLIGKLPGLVSRVRAFSELCERLWCAKRTDLLERVVTKHLRPQLEMARATHKSVGRLALQISFASLCAAHQKLALEHIGELPRDDADAGLHRAALLKIRHVSLAEPDGGSKPDYTLMRPEDVLDVIELISRMSVDSIIYKTIRILVDALIDPRNKGQFTANAKADWGAKLETIIGEKLPDPQNIRHEGYVLVSKAAVLSLKETNWSTWASLTERAKNVPNVADRAFIVTAMAVSLPRKHGVHRKELLDWARKEIEAIPSPVDRLSHMQGYAEEVHSADPGMSLKELLKSAMQLSLDLAEESRGSQHCRELIDLADQIDPALADELVDMVDDDPARIEQKSDARRITSLGKTKRVLLNATNARQANECDVDLLPTAAWDNLGALLAKRVEPRPTDVMLPFLNKVAGRPLDEAYPVLSWHLANLERKYTHANDVRTHLVPHCESVLLAAELTISLLSRVSGAPPDVAEETGNDGMVVRRKTREEATVFLQEWFRANATDTIIVCDPYFSTKDIALLRMCLGEAASSAIRVLASKSELEKRQELSADAFLNAWKQECDQDPPDTEIIALAYAEEQAKHVIHDRWIISGEAGIRLGTSFNSLGENKLSEISAIDCGRVRDLREQLEQYLRRQRIVDGTKIQYLTFTL